MIEWASKSNGRFAVFVFAIAIIAGLSPVAGQWLASLLP